MLGPEAFDAVPFLELLTAYGSPWGQQELTGLARAYGDSGPRMSISRRRSKVHVVAASVELRAAADPRSVTATPATPTSARPPAATPISASVTAPSRLASRCAFVCSAPAAHARTRAAVAEYTGEVGLPRRRRQQVVAAHHLIDALRRVVDDHREVVGRHAVTAAHHEIVDDAGVVAVQQVVNGVTS